MKKPLFDASLLLALEVPDILDFPKRESSVNLAMSRGSMAYGPDVHHRLEIVACISPFFVTIARLLDLETTAACADGPWPHSLVPPNLQGHRVTPISLCRTPPAGFVDLDSRSPVVECRREDQRWPTHDAMNDRVLPLV